MNIYSFDPKIIDSLPLSKHRRFSPVLLANEADRKMDRLIPKTFAESKK
jgi:hypothetical protein